MICLATASRPRRRPRLPAVRAKVDPEDDVGVEHGDQPLEIAVARGGEKRINDRTLVRQIGVGCRLCAADAAARAACELAGRRGRALDDRRDLLERQAEHVVQHEREPLRGRQRLEHDQQREPDRVGEQRFLLGVALVPTVTTGSGSQEPT